MTSPTNNERLEAATRDAAELIEKARQTRTAVAKVRGAGLSPDRSVAVEVDAGGRVTGLRLSSAAMRLGPDQLAKNILRVIDSAVADAARVTAKYTRSITEDPRVIEAMSAMDEELSPP